MGRRWIGVITNTRTSFCAKKLSFFDFLKTNYLVNDYCIFFGGALLGNQLMKVRYSEFESKVIVFIYFRCIRANVILKL